MDNRMIDSTDDVMMMSTNTYILGRTTDSFTPLNVSLLDELDMSNHNSVGSSMVLDNPLLDITLLPIIGDDELETPIFLPNRTLSSSLEQQKVEDTKLNINSKNSNTSNLRSSSLRVPKESTTTNKVNAAPKKPSKNQLIYEKIKQSIENDKNRPRKEVKSKISESLKTFATPKNISREPSALKSRNIPAPTPKLRTPTTRTPLPMSKRPISTPTAASISHVRPTTMPLKSKLDNKVPSTALKSPSSRPSTRSTLKTDGQKMMIDKLTKLQTAALHNSNGFSAMAVMLSHLNSEFQRVAQVQQQTTDELMSMEKANELLKTIINNHMEQNTKTIDEMNKNFDLILKERSDEYDNKIQLIKETYEQKIAVLDRQLAEEKERNNVKPLKLSSGEPNVCGGDCNDEIRSLNMTVQLKNEEIRSLRGESREMELKNDSLLADIKHMGALNAQVERMNHYVRQARDNEKLLTKTIGEMQNEITDLKRKNVDLQQRLDVYQYKMGEANTEMINSTYSFDSRRSNTTRPVSQSSINHEFITPKRTNSNSEMTMSTPMVWSSVLRKTKPKISQDEIYDDGGKIEFDNSSNSMAASTNSSNAVHYDSEGSKENEEN
ncbi:hypothetical protein M3Y94_00379300 [Aphelenchoides besseyi]|nr:hypothetical protein M3Y94_00379300 [Aphelenchoides besseyi]KAI6235101.1 CAP Gly-rich domain-containing protein [Aphelenchoides besseyi]